MERANFCVFIQAPFTTSNKGGFEFDPERILSKKIIHRPFVAPVNCAGLRSRHPGEIGSAFHRAGRGENMGQALLS